MTMFQFFCVLLLNLAADWLASMRARLFACTIRYVFDYSISNTCVFILLILGK